MVESSRKGSAVKPDDYKIGPLRFVRCRKPRLVYLDAAKNRIPGENACNADFFGNYRRNKTVYTLPRGIWYATWGHTVYRRTRRRIWHSTSGRESCGTVRTSTRQIPNSLAKNVSTLVINPATGKPYVEDLAKAPLDANYAVSGVPCETGTRNGDDAGLWSDGS